MFCRFMIDTDGFFNNFILKNQSKLFSVLQNQRKLIEHPLTLNGVTRSNLTDQEV